MSGARKAGKRCPETIKSEIKIELRNILHKICELLRPIDRFYTSLERPAGAPRHFVCFDSAPHQEVTGKRVSVLELRFPVETIADRVALLSASIWHLRDRLREYATCTRTQVDADTWAKGNCNLQICRDIGDHKKHGRNGNMSGVNPRLVPEIVFDTSRSGVLEVFYNGATNQRELLVSEIVPIPYRLDITDGAGYPIGDAATVIRAAFDHWLPLIDRLGIMSNAAPDDTVLLDVLFPNHQS